MQRVETTNRKWDLSGPYNKDNLTVYLIHGEDQVTDKLFLTLDEAMQQGIVKVYETSSVNMLKIENLSKTSYVYIQAGDIVKGGKQDRVLANDLVLEPLSGKVDIASFCVEQSRWNSRAGESVHEFSGSDKYLSSKELHLASRLNSSQTEVWEEVEKQQAKLKKSVGEEVKSQKSASSLQLTLENEKLQEKLLQYKEALSPLATDKENVIGYAFAVNGELNSANVYASKGLFEKLWPKLVESAATEAINEYDEKLNADAPATEEVENWLEETSKGNKSTTELQKDLKQDKIETNESVCFDTYHEAGADKTVYRRNFIKK